MGLSSTIVFCFLQLFFICVTTDGYSIGHILNNTMEEESNITSTKNEQPIITSQSSIPVEDLSTSIPIKVFKALLMDNNTTTNNSSTSEEESAEAENFLNEIISDEESTQSILSTMANISSVNETKESTKLDVLTTLPTTKTLLTNNLPIINTTNLTKTLSIETTTELNNSSFIDPTNSIEENTITTTALFPQTPEKEYFENDTITTTEFLVDSITLITSTMDTINSFVDTKNDSSLIVSSTEMVPQFSLNNQSFSTPSNTSVSSLTFNDSTTALNITSSPFKKSLSITDCLTDVILIILVVLFLIILLVLCCRKPATPVIIVEEEKTIIIKESRYTSNPSDIEMGEENRPNNFMAMRSTFVTTSGSEDYDPTGLTNISEESETSDSVGKKKEEKNGVEVPETLQEQPSPSEFDCFSSEVLNNKVVSDGVYSDKGDEFYAIAPNNMNKNITFQININKYREDSKSLEGEKQVYAKFEKEPVPLKVRSCENKTRKIFSHNCFTSKEDINCNFLNQKKIETECTTTFTMTCGIDYKQIEGKQYGLLTFKIQRKEEKPCIVQFSANEQNETITTNIQTSKSIYTSSPSIPSSTVIVSSKPTRKELSFSDCLTDIILIVLVVILILLLPIILFLIFYKPKPVKVIGKEDETTIVVEDGMTEGSIGMTGS
uniref:Uncharacterized protein n=1 Tax=Meloidogyne javanica TaxID=6303 RepID=A0A915LHF6_MELJA